MTEWLSFLLHSLKLAVRTGRDLAFGNLLLRQQMAVIEAGKLRHKGHFEHVRPGDAQPVQPVFKPCPVTAAMSLFVMQTGGSGYWRPASGRRGEMHSTSLSPIPWTAGTGTGFDGTGLAKDIIAADFLTVPTVTLRTLVVLLAPSHDHGVRTHPSMGRKSPNMWPIRFPIWELVRARRHCGDLHHEHFRRAA